jgi:hypothetical protein
VAVTSRLGSNFHLLGVTIRVESADARDLLWLEDFLVPSFEVVDATAPDFLVSFEADSKRYAHALNVGSLRSVVPCFVLDQQTVAHPLVTSLPVEQIVYDREFDLFYHVRRGTREVLILAAEGNPTARIGLMRVVRELAMGHVWRLEGIVAHAAALQLNGRGIAIAGPKQAGKTTLLTYLLQEQGTSYVANDRVFLRQENGRALVRGLPTLVNLRSGTLATFPHLRDRLAMRPSRSTELTAEQQFVSKSLVAVPSQRSLSPKQFCDLLGVGRSGETDLSVLLFPQPGGTRPGIELAPLPPRAAADKLCDLLLRKEFGTDSQSVFDFGWGPAARLRAVHEATCRAVVSRVRSLTCHLGPEAYSSSLDMAALLEVAER